MMARGAGLEARERVDGKDCHKVLVEGQPDNGRSKSRTPPAGLTSITGLVAAT
jgi:hypothetical protein